MIAQSEYMPLIKGMALYYVHVDYREDEPKVSRRTWRVSQVKEEAGLTIAKVSIQYNNVTPVPYEVRADGNGIVVDGLLDVKLPPREGERWEVDDDYFVRTVLSLDSVAKGVTKDFPNCLEIGIGNEDTDSGSRWYAPGVGFVREEWRGEGRNEVLMLARSDLPRR